MSVEHLTDAAAFLAAAEPLLLADEARHNLILGVAGVVRDRPGTYPEAHFWLARERGEPVGAAMCTPPWNLALARPRSDDVLCELVETIDAVPGVTAATPEVDAFAEQWCARRAREARLVVAQGIYALERVVLPPRPAGSCRDADERDRPLIRAWLRAFQDEALAHERYDDEGLERILDQRLGSPHGVFCLWEDGGEPVSLAGAGARTPNGARVGPVYTPPERRGRGYATSLTAELSQRLLDEGSRFCFLYTDLANPTSNAIYERIGYVRVCESKELRFERR